MPLVKVFTSAEPPSPEQARALLRKLSSELARQLSKPEKYVMTCLVPRTAMTFAGTDDQLVCYAEVKSIGTLTSAQTRALSASLTAELSSALGVSPERTYIEFADAEPHLWGWNGDTFE